MKNASVWMGVWAGLVALAGLALGCDGHKDFEPGGCGLADYDWLPAEQVGDVVAFEEVDDLRMSAGALNAVLEAAGYEQFTPLPYGGRVFTLRYTTQDKGRLVEATGAVAVPWEDGGRAEAYPRVLLLHGTTGFTSACAPSRQADSDGLTVLLLAAHGWVVVTPDYIGLDAGADPDQPPPVPHAYLGVEQVAVGALDMLRATEALLSAELSDLARPTSQYALWGGSQGGHAVFACDRLAPLYAPEFSFQAAMALVPATDVQGLAAYGLSSTNPATAGLAASLISLHRWYEGDAPVDGLLTDQAPAHLASALLPAMDESCSPGDIIQGADDVAQIFQPATIQAAREDRLDSLDPWGCYLRENSFATSRIPLRSRTPILFGLGELDDLVDTATERADFDRLCEMGYALEYLECADAGHNDMMVWSLPEQIAWLRARLAGEAPAPGDVCQRKAPQRCSMQPE